jgi:FkbM family methyltransferase
VAGATSCERRRRSGGLGLKRSGDPQRARKREFWSLARALTPYVAAEHPDGVFLVPTRAHKKFFIRGEPKDARVLERAVDILRRTGRSPEQSTLVEVGAHIGTTTIPALTRHGFARAVAIEPDPDNLRLLRANVALNGLHDRVTVIDGAVTDTPGRRQFLPGTRRGSPEAYLWTKGELTDARLPGSITLKSFTLDSLCEAGLVDPAAAGLVWLDCQKHEERALRSASIVLEHRVPIVFVLRPGKLERSRPLMRALGKTYESVVELRHPAPRPGVDWSPVFQPIDALVTLSDRKRLTDVLVC